ncbi:MAG: efflux transporter outer membrane subunit [Planctomycetes bacterium]|nr:efflux transporter outer membrane subunit [Planctomycetota bacterium]
MNPRRTLPALLSAALGGCTVGPDYRPPDLASPAQWARAEAGRVDEAPADLARWWSSFDDPVLSSLVEGAVRSNLDLRIARARVREVRALHRVSEAALAPTLDAGGRVARERASQNGFFGQSPAVQQDPEFDSFRASLDAGWEIDIFGGLRRGTEAAAADLGEAEEDRRAVLVSLLGEVGRSYVALRGSQRRLAVLRENEGSARETLALTRARSQAGLATDLDVSRAEALLASVEAQVPPLEAACDEAMHRLAVLLGGAPDTLRAELAKEAPIPVPPPRVVVGLPSDLLERRPDLRAAERRLAAATARVGEAEADLYPRVSLTGAFGLESLDSGDFFDAASRAWALGPAVRWPLFAGGRIRATVEANDARAEQAAAAYERAFLEALEEVENALVGYLREWDRRRALADAASANRRAVALADDLFGAGLVTFLDVLDAKRELYDAEDRLAASDAAIASSLVLLYKVLGGGWEVPGRDGKPS